MGPTPIAVDHEGLDRTADVGGRTRTAIILRAACALRGRIIFKVTDKLYFCDFSHVTVRLLGHLRVVFGRSIMPAKSIVTGGQHMAEPVSATIVVSAFVVGAAKGAAKVGEQAVVDAYALLKSVISSTFATAKDLLDSIAKFEKKPDSQPGKGVLAEELEAAGALNHPDVIAAAETVLAAAEASPSYQTIGIDWNEVKAARVKFGEIRVRGGAIGFRAVKSEIQDLEIAGIDVSGEALGKK